MKFRSTLALAFFGFAILFTACDEETLSGPGFICDVTNPVKDILLAPSSLSILVHSPAQESDTAQLSVVATSRNGTARSDVRIKFTSSDESVATVDTLGVVHAKAPGTATIKASACGESRSVVVTVTRSVARVTISPASDTVIVGDTATIVARAFSPADTPLANVKFTFGSATSGATVIQTSDSTAKVVGVSSGSVGLTATGEGVTGNSTLLVLPRVFLAGTVATSTVDVGDAFSCGLITLGHGYCWGVNTRGQLGAATDSICFSGTDAQQLVNDSLTTTALPCSLKPRRISDTVDFTTISAGDATACAVSVAGRAYCWGAGIHGEMGNGSTGDRTEPGLVTNALTFTTISAGGAHVCALAAGGAAYCWGDDAFGQLGDARRVSSTTPIPVSGGGGPAIFASISAGYRHTCALTGDGTAYCWGYNDLGQLGDGSGVTTDTPVQVAGGLKFTWISAGGDHTCGIASSGAAYCWGSNLDGQLGTGTSGDVAFSPAAVAGGLTFTRISASAGSRFKTLGRGHTCALTAAGAAYCWGDDRDLQLGQGQLTGGGGIVTSPSPVATGERGAGVSFTSISAGERHSCAVGTDGNAYCWGSNVLGALGNTLQAAFRGQPQKVATPF